MAAYSLRGLGWFLSAVIAAPACYMVSSQVAAERARMEAIDRSIAQARKDIRMLETEFNTRANLAQLERWNGEVLALTAPAANQFVPGEAALGALNDLAGSERPQLASYIVPSGIIDTRDVATGPVAKVDPAARRAPPPSMPAIEVQAAARDEAKARLVQVQLAAAGRPAAPSPAATIGPARAQAVAMLDRKLLRDTSFNELIASTGEGSRAR